LTDPGHPKGKAVHPRRQRSVMMSRIGRDMYKDINNIYCIFIVSCTVFIVVENSIDTQSKYVIQKSLIKIGSRLSSLISSVIAVYFMTQIQT
jgi:hypothetical protein